MKLPLIVPAGAEVAIGPYVDIAPDVFVECGSHDIGGPYRRGGAEIITSIEIGPGTWIGCRATLLGGIRLGWETIVAAGALVMTGDYSKNGLLAGIPVRIVRTLDEDGAQTL